MTLLPSSDFGIRGYPGNAYDVNNICAVPGCSRASAHCHHMWPRSYLRGQPYEWVKLPDGTILGNRIGMCVEHHEDVNGPLGGYRARLVWDAGIMWWQGRWGEGWNYERLALDPQPPVARGNHVIEDAMIANGDGTFTVTEPVEREFVHGHIDGAHDDTICPVCGHHKHTREPKAKQPRRHTKEWTLTVPDDAEVGADILDSWVDDFAIPLGFTDESSRLRRYHTLVVVLAWAMQHRGDFIHDVAEAAEARLKGAA